MSLYGLLDQEEVLTGRMRKTCNVLCWKYLHQTLDHKFLQHGSSYTHTHIKQYS